MAPGPILPTPTQALSTQWVEDRPMWAAQPQLQMHPLSHLSQEVARLVSKYNWFQFWALKKYCHCHLSIREGSKKKQFYLRQIPKYGRESQSFGEIDQPLFFMAHLTIIY